MEACTQTFVYFVTNSSNVVVYGSRLIRTVSLSVSVFTFTLTDTRHTYVREIYTLPIIINLAKKTMNSFQAVANN